MAVLIITHDLGVVANIADEVVVIYHGEIMEAGPVEEIFRRAGPSLSQGPDGGGAAFRHEARRAAEGAARSAGRCRQRCSASRHAERQRKARRPDILLTVRNLSKSFSTRKSGWFGKDAEAPVRAVDDVSFDIKRGECLGLVGESGCGKTTVSKIIMRALTPDAGAVTFDNGRRADRSARGRGR